MHLILMGAPGSGKGSYATVLKNRYSIPHISTGDMFREAISKKTPLGVTAAFYIDQGKLVPDELTIELVKDRIKNADCEKGFLFDGFPRTIEQAKALTKLLEELNIKLDAVINLEVEDDLVIRRIINRRMCSGCDKNYNLITYPPKKEGICDVCGSALYTRKDDNEKTVKERLNVYYTQTKPLIEYYKSLGNLISIDSNGSIEQAIKDITLKLEA